MWGILWPEMIPSHFALFSPSPLPQFVVKPCTACYKFKKILLKIKLSNKHTRKMNPKYLLQNFNPEFAPCMMKKIMTIRTIEYLIFGTYETKRSSSRKQSFCLFFSFGVRTKGRHKGIEIESMSMYGSHVLTDAHYHCNNVYKWLFFATLKSYHMQIRWDRKFKKKTNKGVLFVHIVQYCWLHSATLHNIRVSWWSYEKKQDGQCFPKIPRVPKKSSHTFPHGGQGVGGGVDGRGGAGCGMDFLFLLEKTCKNIFFCNFL